MVISIIKKLFAGSGESNAPKQPQPQKRAAAAAQPTAPPAAAPSTSTADKQSEPTLEDFVTFVVQSLVDSPDLVSVTSVEKDRATTIQVACDKKDVGKIIGRSGRTIAAIRALTNGAAGRMGKRVTVEVLD